MPKDYQQQVYETEGKARAEAKAAQANKRQEELKSTNIRTSAAGLGDIAAKLAIKKISPPKQADFGSDLKAYGEAMRKWRMEQESNPANIAQKKALQEK
jgi:hypothetical protein